MNIKVSVFGPDIFQGRKITIDRVCPTLQNLAALLLSQKNFPWHHIFCNEHTLKEGYTSLVNGRNIGLLEGFNTYLHNNDEIIFTVIISGG